MNRTCPECGRGAHHVVAVYKDGPDPHVACYCTACGWAWPEPVRDWQVAV